MTNQESQELQGVMIIPEGYKSGFTFFQESAQKDMAELTANELAILIGRWPRSAGRFVHELWRAGRMKVVYDFFVLPDHYRPEEIKEDDIIFDTAVMMKTSDVPQEECFAFIHDLACASQNAHDNQDFGEEPQDIDAVADRIERVMTNIVKTTCLLPR